MVDNTRVRVWIWRLRHIQRYLDAKETYSALYALMLYKQGRLPPTHHQTFIRFTNRGLHIFGGLIRYLFLRQRDEDCA